MDFVRRLASRDGVTFRKGLAIQAPSDRQNPSSGVGVVRVAIYVRISTDEEHQPYSVPAQLARLQAYIGSQPGWILAGPVYRDGKSGPHCAATDSSKP